MSFKPELTKNCAYRNEAERIPFLIYTYFSDIVTYKPGTGIPLCMSDNPGGSLPDGLTYECNDERYLQAAVFKTNSNDVNKYFMIVNRRCSPFINETTENLRGGKRYLRIKIDANSPEFSGYNNWKIINLDSNTTTITFDKNAGALLDLGWYLPGEGKLYKITPVLQ